MSEAIERIGVQKQRYGDGYLFLVRMIEGPDREYAEVEFRGVGYYAPDADRGFCPFGSDASEPTHDAAARKVVRLEIARLRAEADRLERASEATPEGSIEP